MLLVSLRRSILPHYDVFIFGVSLSPHVRRFQLPHLAECAEGTYYHGCEAMNTASGPRRLAEQALEVGRGRLLAPGVFTRVKKKTLTPPRRIRTTVSRLRRSNPLPPPERVDDANAREQRCNAAPFTG